MKPIATACNAKAMLVQSKRTAKHLSDFPPGIRFGADQPKQGDSLDRPDSRPGPLKGEPPTFRQQFRQWVKAGMPLTKVTEKNRRSIPQQIWWATKKTFLGTAIAWSSLWAGSFAYDKTVGDGPIPTMHALTAEDKTPLMRNSSFKFYGQLMRSKAPLKQEVYWEQLQPIMTYTNRLEPEIHQWMQEMYQKGQLEFQRSSEGSGANFEAIAEYNPYTNKVIIYEPFWGEQDGYKIGVLFHEYRHFRQNWGKRLTHLANPATLYKIYREDLFSNPEKFLGLGEDSYGNIMEDDAHLYEYQVYQKMGIPQRYEVLEYLKNRELMPQE